MSNKDTEAVIACAFHTLRSEAKKQRKRDPLAEERERWRRIQQRDNARFSIYPPGWDGEEW
jgi:hypothetical protein